MTDVYLHLGELQPTDVRLYPSAPIGGGAIYNRNVVDIASASDLLTRVLATTRFLSDSVGGSDSVDYLTGLGISVNDFAPASDVVTRSTLIARFLTEELEVSDFVTRQTILNRLLTDQALATDILTIIVEYYVAPTRAHLEIAHQLVTAILLETSACPV